MIKVYWDRIMTDSEIYIRFFISTPFLTLGSTSLDYLRGHKRRRSIRSKFLNPISVDAITSEEVVLDLPSITITEEEFVRWLGGVSLDQVDNMEDISLLLKLKRKYERG